MIFIDFETYNEKPISAGASKYSLTAEVMCMAYSVDEVNIGTWTPGEPLPADLKSALESDVEVVAHNYQFERAIWTNVMVARYGWPEIANDRWRCTMAEALSLGLPASLEKLAKALDLDTEKDMEGRRLMLRLSKPRKPTKKDPSTRHQKPEDLARLVEYCQQDVRTEVAVHNEIKRLNARELKVFQFDGTVNQRGVQIDREMVRNCLYLWKEYAQRLTEELNQLTLGEVASGNEVAKILEILNVLGVPAKSLTKHDVDALLQGEIKSGIARRMLEIRKALSLSSVAKFSKMLECAEPDNRIRGCLQYHGAQTGRFAGRLIQPQNFARGELSYEVIEQLIDKVQSRDLEAFIAASPIPVGNALSSMLRSALVAAPGHKLVVADFAAVEARGLAWAAKEQWLLDAFKNGDDIYKHMAMSIYSVEYDEVTKPQRQVGKAAILGCGYGMGGPKFRATLALSGIETTEETATNIVRAYREKNRCIRSLWTRLEMAAVETVTTHRIRNVGPYTFHRDDRWLYIRMPCGRDIAYYQPEIREGKYGPQVAYLGVAQTSGALEQTSTYGGKLCENVTQAVCRDLMIDAMSRLERAGYKVTLSVHDEVVCEVPEDFGSAEEMESIMTEVPSWAEGFPVGAEGWEGPRYRK